MKIDREKLYGLIQRENRILKGKENQEQEQTTPKATIFTLLFIAFLLSVVAQKI